MSTSANDRDPNNKPVTGYPATGYPPPGQSSTNNYQHNGGGGGGGVGGGNNYHPAGTSYPYTVPPPAVYYNQNQNPYPPQQHPYYYDPQRATFLRRVIVAAITVFLIIGAITFITWLVIRPHLPDIRIDSASLSNFTVSTGGQRMSTGNWDIGFTVRNPNKKMNIYYDRIDSSVFYDDEPITQTGLAPFFQEKKSETVIHGKYAISTYIDDGLLNRMNKDRSDGVVNYNVRMLVWVRFRSGIWRPRRRIMRVYCDNVKIGVSSANSSSSSSSMNGNLIGGPKECDVNLPFVSDVHCCHQVSNDMSKLFFFSKLTPSSSLWLDYKQGTRPRVADAANGGDSIQSVSTTA